MAGNPLLDRLKQYKEFIAIVGAAIGGFVWFDGLVAKQADLESLNARLGTLAARGDLDEIEVKIARLAQQQTVDEISCLLKSYMEVSQRQLRLTQLNNDLSRSERKLGLLEIETKIGVDPLLLKTVDNQSSSVKDEIVALKTEIASEDAIVRQIRNSLELQKCNATH